MGGVCIYGAYGSGYWGCAFPGRRGVWGRVCVCVRAHAGIDGEACNTIFMNHMDNKCSFCQRPSSRAGVATIAGSTPHHATDFFTFFLSFKLRIFLPVRRCCFSLKFLNVIVISSILL